MSKAVDGLEAGDIVEIKYRVWRPAGAAGEDVVERWITASVLVCEPGTWPLARLADGQVTEIRPFMTWRLVIGRRTTVPIAA